MMYIGSAKAFEKRKFNNQDIINELFVAIITFHIIGFTQLVDDNKIKMTFGWSMISFNCVMLASNLVPILSDHTHSIKLCAIKLYRIGMKWLSKNFLTETPKQESKMHDLIKAEKEKIERDKKNQILKQNQELTQKIGKEQ